MTPDAVYKRIEAITKQEHINLIRFIQKYTKSYEIAEEVLQEAYLEALKRAEQIKYPDKLLSWLRTVAKRLALIEMRKQERINEQCRLFMSPEPIAWEDALVNRLTLSEMLCAVLRRSQPNCEAVIRYRYCDDMSFAQIAKELNISSCAARQIHSRTIKKLRKAFGE